MAGAITAEDHTIIDRLTELETGTFSLRDGLGLEETDGMRYFARVSPIFIGAPHATKQMDDEKTPSVKQEKENDKGTGPIAIAVAQELKASCLVMIGEQTGNPNWDEIHAFKRLVVRASPEVYFDIHGMSDSHGCDIAFGTGGFPGIGEGLLAELAAALAPQFGLKLRRNHPKFVGSGLTRVCSTLQQAGIIACQVELSKACRWGEDIEKRVNTIRFLANLGQRAEHYWARVRDWQIDAHNGTRTDQLEHGLPVISWAANLPTLNELTHNMGPHMLSPATASEEAAIEEHAQFVREGVGGPTRPPDQDGSQKI